MATRQLPFLVRTPFSALGFREGRLLRMAPSLQGPIEESPDGLKSKGRQPASRTEGSKPWFREAIWLLLEVPG